MVSMFFLALAAVPLSMGLKIMSHEPNLEQFTFNEFVEKYQRTYKPGTAEWAEREKTFNDNKLQAVQHLKLEGMAWKPGINKFMDWTKADKKKVLGFKPHKTKGPQLMKSMAANDTHAHTLDLSLALPESIDWSTHSSLKFSGKYVRDQGMCGSCWAVSTAAIMESHLEMSQKDHLIILKRYDQFPSMALSSQSLVSCTPNPKHCGGTGGCDGATAPLAFEYIMDKGMPWGLDYQYTSFTGESGACLQQQYTGVVKIQNYVNLPENQALPILQALVQVGPVVLGVAANEWFSYDSGVFAPAKPDWDINHAVSGMGFGKDAASGKLYWLIKNSWGIEWGEEGFIRLDRSNNQCGIDTTPEEGDACEGETDPIKVCGTCGVLYSTSYPVGVTMMQ